MEGGQRGEEGRERGEEAGGELHYTPEGEVVPGKETCTGAPVRPGPS